MDGHTITVNAVLNNWLAGTVDGLPYAVKVCDEKSEYGINGGRIIKLYLFAADSDREIAAYERGWVKYPSRRYEDSMDALITYCGELPIVDHWSLKTSGKP